MKNILPACIVFLTDMIRTHHSIPYLNSDQCMLRPNQKEHGSYGIIFKRTTGFLCDKYITMYKQI
uniref:Uncharacterized protein n=1 Tax=Meloidogyne enterolobii TaxID=390850 RepID=A0A6V7W423_MELEN|nr:unnamed protein product [Meloidogyne enterolobii]